MIIKLLKSNKGMTLIEILVCVTILAIVMPTMLGLFTNSTNYSMKTEEVMEIGYIAQKTMEGTLALSDNLYDINDADHSFLSMQHGRKVYSLDERYDISVQMIPTGFYSMEEDVAYLYIICRTNDILVIGPDGSNNFQSTVPHPGGVTINYPADNSNFLLTYTGSTCAITIGGVTVESNLPSGSATLIVVVNTAGWSQSANIEYNLIGTADYSSANIEIVVCAKIPDMDTSSVDYDYTGINVGATLPTETQYRGVSDYDTTLIQVNVHVYDESSPNGTSPLHSLIDRMVVTNE